MTDLPVAIKGYRIHRLLGRGGGGLVYQAWQESLRRQVALKLLHTDEPDEHALRRFHREARAASQVTHPGLVRIYDSGSESGIHFIVMELISGRTLEDVLDRDGPLSLEAAGAVVTEVLGALSACHAAGLVHRDIKPTNVMIETTGRTRLLDLGLAKHAGSSALTERGLVVGTPVYLPPEVVAGEPATIRSDIYQAGVLLRSCLTGGPPYEAKDLPTLFALITMGPPAPVPGLAPGVQSFLNRALAGVPEDRYADALEARNALTSALAAAAGGGARRPVEGPTRSLVASPRAAGIERRTRTAVVRGLMGASMSLAALLSIYLNLPVSPVPLPATDAAPPISMLDSGWQIEWSTAASGRGAVEVATSASGPWRRAAEDVEPARRHRLTFVHWPPPGQSLWYRLVLDGGGASVPRPLRVDRDGSFRLLSVDVQPLRAVARWRSADSVAGTLRVLPAGLTVREPRACQSHELSVALVPGVPCTLELTSGSSVEKRTVAPPAVARIVQDVTTILDGLRGQAWLAGVRGELLQTRRRAIVDGLARRCRETLAGSGFDSAVAQLSRVRALLADPAQLDVTTRAALVTAVNDLEDLQRGFSGVLGRDAGLRYAELTGPGLSSDVALPADARKLAALEFGDGGAAAGRRSLPAALQPVRRVQPDPFRRGAEDFLLGHDTPYPGRWEVRLDGPLTSNPPPARAFLAFRLHGGRDWDRIDADVVAPGSPHPFRLASLRALGPRRDSAGVIEVDARPLGAPGAALTLTYPNGADHRGIEETAILDHVVLYGVHR